MPGLKGVAGALVGVGLAGSAWQVAAQDRPLVAEFPEVYRAGGLGAPEWALFVDPDRMGFDGAGNLYVLDASRVVIIDPGGGLVRTVGRQGEGPGEFRAAREIAVWDDGRFAVVDIGHLAYQVFGPGGELERFVRMSSVAGRMGVASIRAKVRPDPAGGAVIAEGGGTAAAIASSYSEFEGEQVDIVARDGKLERLDLGGEVAVAEFIAQARRIAPVSVANVQGGRRPWFSPGVAWDVLPGGTIAYFDSTAYEIRLVGPDGGAKGVLGRPLPAEAVTDGIRQAVIDHRIAALEERLKESMAELAETMPEALAEMRELNERSVRRIRNMQFYPEIPVLRDLRATWDGSLWVRRRGEDPWDDNGPVDVIGPDGEYRGTFAPGAVRLPLAFGPDGLVAFVVRDELDVATVVVKRLPAEVR